MSSQFRLHLLSVVIFSWLFNVYILSSVGLSNFTFFSIFHLFICLSIHFVSAYIHLVNLFPLIPPLWCLCSFALPFLLFLVHLPFTRFTISLITIPLSSSNTHSYCQCTPGFVILLLTLCLFHYKGLWNAEVIFSPVPHYAHTQTTFFTFFFQCMFLLLILFQF